MTEPATAISAVRRREVIDALRRGTVPQAGLDLFAVGLERFESAIDSELAAVAAGAAAVKAVRGGDGAGKTYFARRAARPRKPQRPGCGRGGRRRVQGGSWRVRVRQDVLRPLAGRTRQAAGFRGHGDPDLRDGDAAAPAGDRVPAADRAAVHVVASG